MEFRWVAADSDYVLIEGFDTNPHPLEGKITRRFGGRFTFIAVGKGGIVSIPKTCLDEAQVPLGAGVMHVVNDFDRSSYAPAYKDMASTSLPEVEVQNRVIQLLQEWNYSAVQLKSNFVPQGDVVIYTSDYNLRPELCSDDDCGKPVGWRRIERQIAFSVWLERTAGQNAGAITYRLNILPSVVRNFRREDDLWKPDPDSTQIAIPVSKELTQKIKQSLQ